MHGRHLRLSGFKFEVLSAYKITPISGWAFTREVKWVPVFFATV